MSSVPNCYISGVSIIIPKGAIPEGLQQEIYFKVCQDKSILPPLDKEKGKIFLLGYLYKCICRIPIKPNNSGHQLYYLP